VAALRLYLDEDSMRRALVEGLRARGVDVLTALEAGMIERPDGEHLAFAAAEGRALFSFNVGDFARLHAAWLARGEAHAGIVLAPQQRYPIGELIRRLVALAVARSSEDLRGRVEFLSAWGEPG
jgi:Domain of unknown function (DUF5615)